MKSDLLANIKSEITLTSDTLPPMRLCPTLQGNGISTLTGHFLCQLLLGRGVPGAAIEGWL